MYLAFGALNGIQTIPFKVIFQGLSGPSVPWEPCWGRLIFIFLEPLLYGREGSPSTIESAAFLLMYADCCSHLCCHLAQPVRCSIPTSSSL